MAELLFYVCNPGAPENKILGYLFPKNGKYAIGPVRLAGDGVLCMQTPAYDFMPIANVPLEVLTQSVISPLNKHPFVQNIVRGEPTKISVPNTLVRCLEVIVAERASIQNREQNAAAELNQALDRGTDAYAAIVNAIKSSAGPPSSWGVPQKDQGNLSGKVAY